MKPIFQIVFDATLGDCFRACVASIFEFPIEKIPNFWGQTQDVDEFWQLNDDWLVQNKGFRCLHFELSPGNEHVISDLLCVACGKTIRCDEEHAVVWQNKLIHDPHFSGVGLAKDPNTFTIFVPIDPNQMNGKR